MDRRENMFPALRPGTTLSRKEGTSMELKTTLEGQTEEYKAFVDKFKPKHTTDDCYTPPLVYDAVAQHVTDRYGVSPNNFCRPFYPGGDYKTFDYAGKVVVDNPPFSILAEIVDFYLSEGVAFFFICAGSHHRRVCESRRVRCYD